MVRRLKYIIRIIILTISVLVFGVIILPVIQIVGGILMMIMLIHVMIFGFYTGIVVLGRHIRKRIYREK